MIRARLDLTEAEIRQMAFLMPQEVYGKEWRMFILCQLANPLWEHPATTQETTLEVGLTGRDLLAVDSVLMQSGPRGAKLEDGTSVLVFVEKVWGGLLETEAEDAQDRDDDQPHHRADRASALRS